MDAVVEAGAQIGTLAAWKEYLSFCFANRAEMGKPEQVLRRDQCQPTAAVRSLLSQYKKLCRTVYAGAPTLVLYGNFGSGKSQSLLTIVRGNSPWNPDRAIYVNSFGTVANGNDFLKGLSETLKFPGETNPRNLAEELVETAAKPSTAQLASDYLGCCGTVEQADEGKLILFSPPLPDTDLFDKLPVIALDNVKFRFGKDDKLSDEAHASFLLFITTLFEYAYAEKVVVVLGISNRLLAEELVALNGTTKIVPAAASLTKDTNDPHFVQHSVCMENDQEVNYTWRIGLGWTKETMKMFLRRQYRTTDDEVIERAASAYGTIGNLRAAICQVEEEFPSIPTETTSASDLEG